MISERKSNPPYEWVTYIVSGIIIFLAANGFLAYGLNTHPPITFVAIFAAECDVIGVVLIVLGCYCKNKQNNHVATDSQGVLTSTDAGLATPQNQKETAPLATPSLLRENSSVDQLASTFHHNTTTPDNSTSISTGNVCENPDSLIIEKIVNLPGHKGYFTVICTSSSEEINKIKLSAFQLPILIEGALGACDLSDQKKIDELLKKVFSEFFTKSVTGDLLSATGALIINDKSYILNLGSGVHTVLISRNNQLENNNGCYEVSRPVAGSKRVIYFHNEESIRQFEDKDVVEILPDRKAGKPSITHLDSYNNRKTSNGGGTIIVPAKGYSKGDYLVLGCEHFWQNHSLNSCYQIIDQGAKGSEDPAAIANKLAHSIRPNDAIEQELLRTDPNYKRVPKKATVVVLRF